ARRDCPTGRQRPRRRAADAGLPTTSRENRVSTSPLERRYRRVLRLLPAGYRHRWEEDMVASFMAAYGSTSTADARRPRLGEVASVVTLAVRARFFGLHATPRAQAWYDAIRAFALLSLLLEALFATSVFASSFDSGPYRIDLPDFIVWSRAFGLLWVVAFVA